ncbi:hypothetical protein ACF0H5_000947 [Mactra antiquata]
MTDGDRFDSAMADYSMPRPNSLGISLLLPGKVGELKHPHLILKGMDKSSGDLLNN